MNAKKITFVRLVDKTFVARFFRNVCVAHTTKTTTTRHIRYQAVTSLDGAHIAVVSLSRETIVHIGRVLSSIGPEDGRQSRVIQHRMGRLECRPVVPLHKGVLSR